jgi:hypothetical protein
LISDDLVVEGWDDVLGASSPFSGQCGGHHSARVSNGRPWRGAADNTPNYSTSTGRHLL